MHATALARAHRWKELLEERRYDRLENWPKQGVTRSMATRLLWLTLPALHVVGAILEGMSPKVYSAGEVDRAKSK
jgi:hypothetical protein